MSYVEFDERVYNYPEKFGLSIVGELDPYESYEFNTIVVFTDINGNLFWAHDSGCSCPSPFESTTVADLVPINGPSRYREFMRAVTDLGSYRSGENIEFQTRKVEFKMKVAGLYREVWARS